MEAQAPVPPPLPPDCCIRCRILRRALPEAEVTDPPDDDGCGGAIDLFAGGVLTLLVFPNGDDDL